MFDLITIGDPTVDTFIIIDEKSAKLQCNIKSEKCLLCLNYADKIPFEKTEQSIGGNAANLAVGCKKFGLNTAIVADIGDDINGIVIKEELKKNKINTDLLKILPNHQSRYSIIINYQTERTILSYHTKHHYSLPKLPQTKYIYYSSLGRGFEKIQNKLEKYLIKNPQTKLVINPGSYQMKYGLNKIKNLFPQTEILFVNKEEAQKLTKTNKDIPELLKILHNFGIKIVVITNGKKGSFAFDGKNQYFMPIYPLKTIALTGAGDAYASGFLSAIIKNKDIVTAMCWGTANAGSVTQKIGAQKGLLSVTGVKKIIQKYPRITPKIF